MDAAHEAHLHRILSAFSAEARTKYEKGQAEHGGNLWMKPGLLECAIEEAIDQVIYLLTLREQMSPALLRIGRFCCPSCGVMSRLTVSDIGAVPDCPICKGPCEEGIGDE